MIYSYSMLENLEIALPPLNEFSLSLHNSDLNLLVRYSPEQMRRDVLEEAKKRQLDVIGLERALSRFSVVVIDYDVKGREGGVFGLSYHLSTSLERSIFNFVVMRPALERYLVYSLK